jgi:hypothetical protein
MYASFLKSLKYRIAETRIYKMVRSIQNMLALKVVTPFFYGPKLSNYVKPIDRNMPCFLILRYKYAYGDKEYGDSNEEHAVSMPLRSAKVADSVEFYYDLKSLSHSAGIWGDRDLVNLVLATRPDLIILSSYAPGDPNQPRFDVLRTIRAKCNIPILIIWHDSVAEQIGKECAYMLDDIDLNVMLDAGALAQRFSNKEKFLRLWAPLDYSVFYPDDRERDVSVSFLGSTAAYRDVRLEYLDYLKGNEVDIFHSGGQAQERLSQKQYADILRQSKISLNFSFSLPGTHQLKVRVFEIMFSCALLMENENSETLQYFTPMVDYVTFESKEDLLDKVRYYLEHEDERREIAHNGYVKATQEYSHHAFWKKTMDRLEERNLLIRNLT